MFLEDVFEALEVRFRVDDRLELLERELVCLKHQLDDIFVEPDLVLAEEVNQLIDVESARSISVEFVEDLLDDLVLLDLGRAHQVLFLHRWRSFATTSALGSITLLARRRLLELIELHLLLQPFLRLV